MADTEVYSHDMSQTPDPGEVPAPGTYHVRVSKVETKDANGNQLVSKESGKPKIQLHLKVQTEGPMFGRTIPDSPSLEPTALFKLKAYYNAAGYRPGAEGHNPHKLLDAEFYILVEPSTYKGNPSFNIPPWGITSLTDGPKRR